MLMIVGLVRRRSNRGEGSHDPCVDYGLGVAKKRRTSPVEYTKEEDEWE
jgi:hypothetical protein